jgi:putative ABC transport system permease protein
MKIIMEYSLAHIRRNWRSSIAVMIAVLLSSTMLLSICMTGESFWKWMVDNTIWSVGNWHGELYQDTTGSQLAYIMGNPYVEEIMLKGSWMAGKLPDKENHYLLIRDANQAYWREMPEKNKLITGRLPEKSGDLLISKSFFEENPTYSIGDKLTLPMGERILEGKTLDIWSTQQQGESFCQTEEREFTIVGEMDQANTSAYPGYYALGFLEESKIIPDDRLTVYLKINPIRDTYKVLPQIAAVTGGEKDTLGQYSIRYNENLLFLNGVFAPGGSSNFSFVSMAQGAMNLLGVVLVLLTFALIIRGVFSLSAQTRLKQYGIMRSIGASPNQIKGAVFWEAVFLSILPIAVSIVLGYVFTSLMLGIFQHYLGDLLIQPITIFISIPVICLGVLLSVVTVLVAANKPAKQMAAMIPIEAVVGKSQNRAIKVSKRKYRITKRLFGFPGILARDTLHAHRKTMRSPVAALCISLVLVGGAAGIPSITTAHNQIMETNESYSVTATCELTDEIDPTIMEQIRNLPGVISSTISLQTNVGMTVNQEDQTELFLEMGGFEGADSSRFPVETIEGGFRLRCRLMGMDEESYEAFCQNAGLEGSLDKETRETLESSQENAGDLRKGILVDAIRDHPGARTLEKKQHVISMLKTKPGDILRLEESYQNADEGTSFVIKLKGVTLENPDKNLELSQYCPIIVLPMKEYYAIVRNFSPLRANGNYQVYFGLYTKEQDQIAVEKQVKEICENYFSKEDYYVESQLGVEESQQKLYKAVEMMDMGIAVLFAIIGISNAFSSVTGNLRMRRREFAMLRSVGLDRKGLNKILFLEGLFFAAGPVAAAVPILAVIYGIFLWMLDVSFSHFLEILPWGELLIYFLSVLAVMGIAYYIGAKAIQHDSVAEALRDTTQ